MDQQRVDVRARPSPRGRRRPPRREYSRGFHARGFWLKIWIARQPRSTPRSTAFAGPPAGETWAPISMRTRGSSMLLRRCASASLPRRPAPCTSAARAPRCTTGSSRAATGGELVLRIEDTDRERSTPENVEQIFDALRWLELDWDEEPVFQSQRAERHAEVVEQLLDDGPRLPLDRRAATRSRRSRRPTATAASAARTRARARCACACPTRARPTVRDVIRGETAFENALQDDLVIARADGTPVYHLAVVVDDLDAGITHVVRGADHYSNTPKQLLILQAMGAEPPVYAHLPLLHGPDGKKLSKRHGAASVQELRDARLPARGGAQLPRAARLGLRRARRRSSRPRSCQRQFSLERVSKSPAVFDEQKLRWMNGRYLRELGARRADRAAGGAHRPRAACATRSRSRRRRSRRSTSSGRWRARSSTEPADDPAAREKFLAPDAGARGARASRARRSPTLPEPWTHRGGRGGAARGGRALRGEGRSRSSSRCASRSPGRRSRPGSSRRSRCSAATRRCARIDAALDGRRAA